MKRFFAILFVFLMTSFSYAGVHLRNGNFFVSYTDLSATEKGMVLELTRTYNSKSIYKGWFGFGWGTPFEVRLEASSDGSIMLYENGSGAVNRFVAGKITEEGVKKVVEEIVTAVKKAKPITAEAEKSLRASLSKDDQYRHRIAKKYGVTAKHTVGQKFNSEDFGGQSLEITSDGYLRKAPNGLDQYFNKDGVITKTRNQAGYGLDFTYNKANQVVKIVDTNGSQFMFDWHSSGFVKSVTSQDKKKAEFSYNGEDLSKVTDADNITFNYEYDANHNLTKLIDTSIKDAKSNAIVVEYDPKTLNATKVTSRDGSVNSYFYEFNPKRPKEETTTIVIRTDASGSSVAEKYLYDYRKRADGSEWLARTQTITDGNYDPKSKKFSGGFVEEAIYNESSPYPIKKIEGDTEALYTYLKNGLLESKVIKYKGKVTEKAKYGYDPKFNKINFVKTDKAEYKYEYNTKGDLVKAIEKNGNAILFVYDIEGRISKMYEKTSAKNKPRTLAFTYNVKGKPTEVELEGIGKLTLTYDSQSQSRVEDIKSSKGLEVFNQVREVFNNFMDVVKPTGINMSL
jgi:YD repeat-containing protein